MGWERWELGSHAKLLLPRACPRWRPGDTGQLPVVTPQDLGSRSAPSPLLLCPFPRMSPQTPCPEPCEPCGFPSTPRVSFLPQSHRIPVPISLPSLEQPGAPPHPPIPPSRCSQPVWGTRRIFGIRFPVTRAGLLGATSQGLLGNKSLKEPRGLLGYTSWSRGGPREFIGIHASGTTRGHRFFGIRIPVITGEWPGGPAAPAAPLPAPPPPPQPRDRAAPAGMSGCSWLCPPRPPCAWWPPLPPPRSARENRVFCRITAGIPIQSSCHPSSQLSVPGQQPPAPGVGWHQDGAGRAEPVRLHTANPAGKSGN